MSEILERFSLTRLVGKLLVSFILGLAIFITFFPNKTEIIKTSTELIAPLSIGVIGALIYDSVFFCMALLFFGLTIKYKSKIREGEKLNEAKKEENDH